MAFDPSTAKPVGQSRFNAAAVKSEAQMPATQRPGMLPGPIAQPVAPAPPVSAMDRLTGLLETGGAVGTGMTTGLLGRTAGFLNQLGDEIIGGGFAENPREASDRIERAALRGQSALTYTPRTQAGQEFTQALGEAGEALAPLAPLGAEVQALTTSAKASGQLANIALRNVLSKVGKNRPLIVNGQPTPILRRALTKEGLDFNNLTPETKGMLNQGVRRLTQKGAADAAAEKAFVNEIKAGGRSDALAPYTVNNGKLAFDLFANKAIKQGFEPGLVQSIKTTNPATRAKMAQMNSIMRQIKKQSNIKLTKRPSDIVGKIITDRIKFIRDSANNAKTNLDKIARTQLRGKKVDTTQVINQLEKSLDDLDVRLDMTSKGAKAMYKGSLISKDRTSQRVINDLIDLLNENVRPDALRAHKLKRQLDILIDFNKKSSQGLTDAGRNVLKDVRHSLNQVVRDVDKGYAKANDTLSQALDTLNSLDDAVGTIDIFGKGADKALGTRMRALLSNQQSRVRIENAIDDLTDTVKAIGGKTDVNLKDLIEFSDALDARFGTPATASFAGDIQKATSRAINQGVSSAAREGFAEKAGNAFERMRGINDDAAFEAMSSLLKKSQQ